MSVQPSPAGPGGGLQQSPAAPRTLDGLRFRGPDRLAPQPDQDVRYRDLDRADLDAGIAEAGGMRQILRHIQSRYLRRQDLADWAGIDRVIGMSSHTSIDGTVIHAGATADTTQRLAQFQVG